MKFKQYIKSENAIFRFEGIVWAVRYESKGKPMIEIEYDNRSLKTVFSDVKERDKIYAEVVQRLLEEQTE